MRKQLGELQVAERFLRSLLGSINTHKHTNIQMSLCHNHLLAPGGQAATSKLPRNFLDLMVIIQSQKIAATTLLPEL